MIGERNPHHVSQKSAPPKGSFYFHFPGGKHQLGLEAVVTARTQVEQLITNAVNHRPDDFAHAVQEIAQALARWLEATGFREGCAVAAMTIETASISSEMQAACRDAYESWQATFTEQLQNSGLDKLAASSLATLIVSSLEGAVILCRAAQTAEPVRSVGVQLAAMLAGIQPAAQS